jgi:hypothetical protein
MIVEKKKNARKGRTMMEEEL